MPGLSLAITVVSENHIDTTAALNPVRDLDVGLKYPKNKPSMNMKTLPVVGPGRISPWRDDEPRRFLTTEDI